MPELISILLPVWNEERTITGCIRSCLAQTYTNIEIVVVDNCSTDNTIDEIRSINDERIKLYCNMENLGVLKNHELALTYAAGHYIKFVGADDLLYPNCIDLLYQKMMSGEFIGVGGIIDDVLENGEIVPVVNRCRLGVIDFRSHTWRPNPFYFFSLLKREIALRAIPFDPLETHAGLGADLMFMAKILSLGSIMVINQPVSAYRCKDRSRYTQSSSRLKNKIYGLNLHLVYLKKLCRLVKNSQINLIKRMVRFIYVFVGFLKTLFDLLRI